MIHVHAEAARNIRSAVAETKKETKWDTLQKISAGYF